MRSWTRTAALAAGLMLAACGGGEPTKETPPTPAPPPPTPPSTAATGADADVDEAEPLSIFLDANVIEGTAPLTVNFDVDVDGGTAPLKWAWDYGDGNTGDAADPKHSYVYEKPGVFMVELEVEDSTGDSDFDILEIEVFEE